MKATIVDAPGVYSDIPDTIYHADPVPSGSLSVSGAKLLLPPNCPALYDYQRKNPPKPKPEYTFGHAAHKLVLGVGAKIVTIDADSYRTKKAQEERDAAIAAGHIPMLPEDVAVVEAMAQKIREHEIASALLSNGLAEQSLFAQDPDTGVWLRGRLDWLPNPSTSGRMIIGDYKTAVSASPEKFERALMDYSYFMQAPWYVDLALSLGLAEDVKFVFIVQEKVAPYLVSVFEPDAAAMRIGRYQNRQAIDLYAKCTADERWPGYTDGVELLSLPYYYERKFEDVA